MSARIKAGSKREDDQQADRAVELAYRLKATQLPGRRGVVAEVVRSIPHCTSSGI